MELIKNNLHMKKIIKKENVTFYVNREESLEEGKPPINAIICHDEQVAMDNVQIRNNQVVINGTIGYSMLYYQEGSHLVHSVEKEIPFEEIVKIMGISEDSDVSTELCISSASIKLINGENYIYKIQINGYIVIEQLEDLEVPCEIKENDLEKPNNNLMKKFGKINSLSMVIDTSDNFKISEQIIVPQSKPPIYKIIWNNMRIKNASTKLVEGGIEIKGELYVYIMYIPDDEEMPQQWLETTLNFSGIIDKSEISEEMIEYVNATLNHSSIETQLDQDNEVRILDINALLDLNIKVYKEIETTVLEDAYIPNKNLIPIMKEQTYETLLVKNASRTKEIIKLKTDSSKGGVLQICNSNAEVKVNNITVVENGLKVSGKMKAEVMYISGDDSHPVRMESIEKDFEHRIDAEGIGEENQYYMNWRVEQVAGNMLSTEEIEIKAVVVLEAMVFKEKKINIVDEIKEEPLDMEKIANSPIMCGYIVQSKDTLWGLAKKHYTTIEKISQTNDLKSDQIKPGDKLLIIKSC